MPGLRVPHIIRGNASGAAPQAWIVVDTETVPVKLAEKRWQHVFRLGVACYWRPARETKREIVDTRAFTDRMALLEWIAERPRGKERIGMVAHNIDFDAQVLDTNGIFPSLGYTPTKLIIDRGKWLQRWRAPGIKGGKDARTLLLIDLANFYPMPLRELAAWLGMQKWPLPKFDESDEVWERYCRHDVEIELAALRRWLEFRNEHDLGYFAPTLAGQAFNAFRHRFMAHKIYVHVHPDVIDLERRSYVGGRVEPFWRGRAAKREWVQLDHTSFYGGVQLGNLFPTKQVGHSWRVSPARLREVLETHLAIAEVEIETDVPAFPCRIDGHTRFPVGRFRTVLATPELRMALAGACVREVRELIVYEGERIFDDYVSFFWRIRSDAQSRGDVYAAELAKRFLTGLYGKFGQRVWMTRLLHAGLNQPDQLWSEYDLPDSRWYEYRIIGGRFERRGREIMGRDTLLAIPSHVTSYGRVRLWECMQLAGLDNVMYVDTDSLIVNTDAMPYLAGEIAPDQLGGLRVVYRSRDLYIRAPKWYRLGHKIIHGGVRDNAEELDGDRFVQDEFRSMKWALRREHAGTAVMDEVTVSAPYRGLLLRHPLGRRLQAIQLG